MADKNIKERLVEEAGRALLGKPWADVLSELYDKAYNEGTRDKILEVLGKKFEEDREAVEERHPTEGGIW